MNTTSLHIQIDTDIKKKAQRTAQELGLSLSAVTKVLLKQFIRTKRLSVELDETPNAYLKYSLEQSEKDIKAGRTTSFASGKDALSYLIKEIENEKRSTH
jgi:addiction module RelB/DinJ family antitoxin